MYPPLHPLLCGTVGVCAVERGAEVLPLRVSIGASAVEMSANVFCRFALAPELSLPKVAESLPFTFTGADLYALCSDAMLKAITRSARAVDARVATINDDRQLKGQSHVTVAGFFDHYAKDIDTVIEVIEDDFVSARKELVPSVSAEELYHYERVRDSFEGPGARGAGVG